MAPLGTTTTTSASAAHPAQMQQRARRRRQRPSGGAGATMLLRRPGPYCWGAAVLMGILLASTRAGAASVSPSSRGYYNNAAAGPESDTDRGGGGRGGGNGGASGRGGSQSQWPTSHGGPYGASGAGGGGGGGRKGGGGGPKKPLSQPKYRTLQRLLQDLEESDYGGIGAWGEFNTNPRRRVSRSFTSEQQQQQAQSLGGFGSGMRGQPPSAQGPGGAAGGPQGAPMMQQGGPEDGQVDGYWGPSSLQQGQQGAGGAQAGAGGQGGVAAGGKQGQEGNLPVPFYQELMFLQQQQQGSGRGDLDDFPSRIISMASVARVGALVLLATGLSYLAVVPRTAPTQHYNYLFKINLLLVLASMAWPLLLLGLMYNPREINVNHLIRTFFTAATTGYVGTFLAEVVGATALKLAAFYHFEPKMHATCPEIPSIHLPWVWKESCTGYRPRLLTLLVADLAINCLASPLLEEGAKLLVYRWCSWVRPSPAALAYARARAAVEAQAELEAAGLGEEEDDEDGSTAAARAAAVAAAARAAAAPRKYRRPDTVHSTLVYMIAASLGLKAADNARRILLYTRPQDTSKAFFALARGLFPVQELCGAFTALNLARRDILGERMSWLRLLAPAVILHSMANFRGMKPLFKWASSSPWTEMQLQALSAPDYATALQQIWKAVWGLVWFAVLARVLGYLMYKHYLLSKQVKLRYQSFFGAAASQ